MAISILKYLLFVALLLFPFSAYAEKPDGKTYFKNGITFFEEGNYKEAVENLTIAYEELPAIGDYILLYISKAHLIMGNTAESIKTIQTLLKRYPDSPVKGDAKSIEILNSLMSNDEDKTLQLLHSYVKDFPSDSEMKFLFAYMLKKTDPDKAKSIFKELYANADLLSEEAYKELKPSDILAEDLLKRASNLIANVKYKEAESCLRTALASDDGTLKKDILEKLALSLFRQKRYNEAAKIYIQINNLYEAARAFFRAGEETAFNETLNRLISDKDIKAAELLIAYADDKRRNENTNEALKLLSEVKTKYPSMAEEALWRTGWTYYISKKKYKKALEIFTELYNTYKSSKYLYWKAKATEKINKDASHIYKSLITDDFYGVLARIKTDKTLVSTRQKDTPLNRQPMERADTLIEAGLKDEAVTELMYQAEKTTQYNKLLNIALRLKEIGQYRKAILLTTRLPYEIQPDEILYPLAYWNTIKKVSAEHDIDPFLLLAVMREESRFDPEAHSPAGAIGLMQLMPQTARRTARSLKLDINDIFDIETNVKLGTHYLNGLIKKFGSVPVALAAYNAGEHRVKKWLKNGNYDAFDEFIEDIPFKETRKYIKRIVTTYFQYRKTRYTQASEGFHIL